MIHHNYDQVDEQTTEVIANLFGKKCTIELVESQKQIEGRDCGVFAISTATTLCFGLLFLHLTKQR